MPELSRAMNFIPRHPHQPMSSPKRTCALLTLVVAVASSLRLDTGTGSSNAVLVESQVASTGIPTIRQTIAAAANMSGRHGDRRHHVIRGEREAAVITRLPQMKVMLFIVHIYIYIYIYIWLWLRIARTAICHIIGVNVQQAEITGGVPINVGT